MQRNEHGVHITPAAEDLKRAQAMLDRELRTGPRPGKARMIQGLKARIDILRKRAEGENA